jgi:2-methylaconitate cis-trans-isomerase PrpF
VAEGVAARSNGRPATVTLEHASGQIDVLVDYDLTADGINLRSAGLVRTARLLARGEVMVPAKAWTR